MANIIQANLSLAQHHFLSPERIHILPFNSTVTLKNGHAFLHLHWMAFNFHSIFRSSLFDQWFNYLQLTSSVSREQQANYQLRSKYFKTDTKSGLPFLITYQLAGENSPISVRTVTSETGHCQVDIDISNPKIIEILKNTTYVTGQFSYGSTRFQLSYLVNNFSIPNPYQPVLLPKFRVVISDIDDTIKYSNVLDKSQLLINTFLNPFQVIPDIASEIKNANADFYYYVSSSPYQLWIFLYNFLKENNFPQPENIRLRQLVSHNITNLWKFLENGPSYKITTITEILQNFHDGCEVYLYGDSGESDPEIYNQIALTYPNLIKKIVIRNVRGSAPPPLTPSLDNSTKSP